MLAVPTSLADWLIILPLLLCLGGAAVLVMLREKLRLQWLLYAAVVLTVVILDGFLFARVLSDGPLTMTMGKWLPPFRISFTADVLGAGFALVAAFATLGGGVFLSLGIVQGISTPTLRRQIRA